MHWRVREGFTEVVASSLWCPDNGEKPEWSGAWVVGRRVAGEEAEILGED